MGLTAVLRNERRNDISEPVCDSAGVIYDLLPDPTDTSYCCARFIDPYGDTVFNQLQAHVLLEEWDRLEAAFAGRNAKALWAGIRKLIVRCLEEVHVYLAFLGD